MRVKAGRARKNIVENERARINLLEIGVWHLLVPADYCVAAKITQSIVMRKKPRSFRN